MRRLALNEPLAIFRTQAGAAVVLEDRCRHRLAPLSAGRADRRHDRMSLSRTALRRRRALHPCAGTVRHPGASASEILRGDRALRPRLGLDERPRRRRPGEDARLAMGGGRRLGLDPGPVSHQLQLHAVGRQPDGSEPCRLRAQDHHRIQPRCGACKGRHDCRAIARHGAALGAEAEAAAIVSEEARLGRAGGPLAAHRVPASLLRPHLQGHGQGHLRHSRVRIRQRRYRSAADGPGGEPGQHLHHSRNREELSLLHRALPLSRERPQPTWNSSGARRSRR